MTVEAKAVADELVSVGSGNVSAVLLFGSRLVGAAPSADSAYDFVVIVDQYAPFYRALTSSGHHERSPRLLAALARILAPNVVSFLPDLPGSPVSKCQVLTSVDFRRALGLDARDHFVKGRMVQQVAVLHARDRQVREWVEDLLAAARRSVFEWVAPYLDVRFDAEGLARRMLRVSYRGEIRPEARDRVDEVFEAQRDALVEMYSRVLEEAESAGDVVREEDGWFRLARTPGALDRFRVAMYFFRSKIRSTARWLKHVLTFNDWLTYIQRKVERRTGRRVEITPLERKYPLIFLWPKVFRVVRTLPRGTSDEEGSSEASVSQDPP